MANERFKVSIPVTVLNSEDVVVRTDVLDIYVSDPKHESPTTALFKVESALQELLNRQMGVED